MAVRYHEQPAGRECNLPESLTEYPRRLRAPIVVQ